MSGEEELTPKEAEQIRSRERKLRRPRMVLDNAGVKRIQLALRNRTKQKKK
jgi:hypothetical protein